MGFLEENKETVRRQTAMYHKFNDLVREGDYYRIASYGDNHLYDCFQVVSRDKKESLVFYVQVLGEPNRHGRILRLQGLDDTAVYHVYEADMQGDSPADITKDTGKVYSGQMLKNGGMLVERMWGDFRAKLIWLKRQ